MHKRMGLRWSALMLVLAAVAALALACGGDDDDTGDDDTGDDDTGDDDDSNVDTTPPDPPSVNDIPDETGLLEISLSGFAEPASTVRVTGGLSAVATGTDPDSGQFCLAVDLRVNAENELSVTASDRWRNESEPTVVSVTQDPSLLPDPVNGSLTGTASAASTSTTDCPDCVPASAIDGNSTSYWRNSTNFVNPAAYNSPQWIAVDLGEAYRIESATVLWGGDYGTNYSLYYSTIPGTPQPPHLDLGQWTFATQVGSGDGSTDQLNLPEPVTARHWALLLFSSSRKNGISNLYYYEVREFELNGVPESELPQDPGCP